MAKRTETHTHYEKPFRRFPVTLFNGALSLRDWRRDFDPDKLIASAQKASGEIEFSDAPLREPLEQLCQSIRDEAQLNPLGAFMQSTRIKKILINRLRMDALMRAHPEWLRAPDPDIIAIAGLARSGTTLLQRLMCADPGVRPLLTWEAMSPAPLPDEVAGHPVKRVAEAQQAASFMRYIAPDFSAIHALVVDAPEEDLLLLDMTFMTQSWEAVMWLPSWSKWLEAADNQPAYDYLRNVLKVLIGLSGGAERLVLKTPHHAERLSELLTAFPTATILQTHRDPVKTIPSVCSMIAHMYGAGSNHVDPSQVGTHWLHKTRLMSKKARAARTADPDRVFVDLLYQDLVTDPVSVLERVYAAWGKDLPDEVRAAAAENTVRKATSSRMRHRYRSTDFGFTDEGLRAAFSLDIETYGIPFEEHSA